MTAPAILTCSRAIPVDVETAFRGTLPIPLPVIFGRWYGPIAPVRSTSGDEPWGTVGQSRVVNQVGGGTMHEELVAVDAPHSFSYQLTDISGPLKPLIERISGRWSFEPVGTGTRVTWEWRLHPASRAASLAVPVIGRLWQGYARQALEELSGHLLAGD